MNDKYSKMAEHSESDKDTAYAEGYAEGWHTGATEYATKLHQEQQENEQLKRWKDEQLLVWGPVLDYGLDSDDLKIGGSISTFVLERCKQFERAHKLLEKVAFRHEGGLLPDRFIYEEIKTFLDGTK
jgi:hypothetical protein